MADHVVMGNNSVRCLHCGEEFLFQMPCGIETFLGAGRGFERDHAACRLSERGRARFEYSTVAEWRTSWDTGISSITIDHFMSGAPLPTNQAPPADLGDVGRCVRLLDVADKEGLGWRARIGEMADVPGWANVIAKWSTLEQAYRAPLFITYAPDEENQP